MTSRIEPEVYLGQVSDHDRLGRTHDPLATIPGGNYTSVRWPGDRELVFTDGRGSRITDQSGREYLDYLLGAGPSILGHAHPAVVRAIGEQAGRLIHSYGLSPEGLELGEELVERTPGAEMVRLTNSGSEATFYALRLARARTGRSMVLKFEGGYHGHHDYGMWSVNTLGDSLPAGAAESAGIPDEVGKTVLVAPFNDVDATVALIRKYRDDLAAVITEPAPKGIMPRPGFLQMLREETAAHGIVLIFDEIVSGFRFNYGPLGHELGVDPDITTYGKVIGGGLPLAAIVGNGDLLRLSDWRNKGKSTYVYVSGTHYGNPVASAAGLAMLGELRRPGVYEELGIKGQSLRDAQVEIFRDLGLTTYVFGYGSTFHVLFGITGGDNIRDLSAASTSDRNRFVNACLERGVLLNLPARSFVSVAHTTEDLARTIGVFRSAAEAMVDG